MKWFIILMIISNCVNNKVSKNESDKRNVLLPFIFSDSAKNNCLTKTTVMQYEEKECQQ